MNRRLASAAKIRPQAGDKPQEDSDLHQAQNSTEWVNRSSSHAQCQEKQVDQSQPSAAASTLRSSSGPRSPRASSGVAIRLVQVSFSFSLVMLVAAEDGQSDCR